MVEGARLESVYTANTVSGVRIPDSPPFFYFEIDGMKPYGKGSEGGFPQGPFVV